MLLSADFRVACAPFQRIENAKKKLPVLLIEFIQIAMKAVPYIRTRSSLIASLILVDEIEKRVSVLEKAVPYTNVAEHEKADGTEQTKLE